LGGLALGSKKLLGVDDDVYIGKISIMANELWVEPPSLHFKHDQEEQLKKTLDLDRHLILSPLNSSQDVSLDAEANVGMVFGSGCQKYKLTRWALFQLCQLTCPSLYGFITDLSGVQRTKDTDRDDYSFSEALDALNRTVKRRFRTHLQGKVALVDMARKTVDGFVSGTYRWLPNYELYERTKDVMSQVDDSLFLEATLVGRWMMIRYVEKKPHLKINTDNEIEDPIFVGYHFSNNEVGKAAVKAANMLYRKFSHSAAINTVTSKDTGLRHAGLRFEIRFGELVKGLLNRRIDPAKHLAGIRTMQETMLGLGNKSSKVESKRMDDLTAKLVRRGIPASIARSVVINTAHQGSYDELPIEPSLYRPKERTAYDLYNALGRCAVSLPINHRERAEQVAHYIMMGKVSFD
jgi:hypothetical protein